MGRDTVILSPHFDDAVLSCWHVLASAGEVLVVNVFAGEPPAGALGGLDDLPPRQRLYRDGPLAVASATLRRPSLTWLGRHGLR